MRYEYKVLTGKIIVGHQDVVIENLHGEGKLQDILNHYGSQGFDITYSFVDNLLAALEV